MLQIQDKSINTKLALDKIKEIDNPVINWLKQSKEDEEKVWYFTKRKQAMDSKRGIIHKKWSMYVKQYEALFVPYRDGRSSSNIPLERAIIELFIAEATKRPTRFNFNPCLWYEFQTKILEKVWKEDWAVNNRNSTILENEYLTAMFWTSILYTWYSEESRVIEDFDWIDDEGKIKFQRKLWTKSNIDIKNVDIRNFWVDDRASKIEDAVDCVYEEYITREDFMNYKFDKNYKNLDTVWPSNYKFSNDMVFAMQEEKNITDSKYVKISKYWNTQLDRYYEVANDKALIKEHPILNASHSLPFVVRQYWKNLFSIYGYWLCEALTMFKSEINTLREMLMDAIKRSNQEVIAIWGNLSFDWNEFAYNNNLMKFKGNLAWNFQQLQWTPPNQAIFTYLQQLYKDVAIFVWIDIQNLLWEPQQTAYQTAVQKESSLQRLNAVFNNRDTAFERLANLHKDNIQMFYPLKLVRELTKIDKDDKPMEEMEKTYPTIEVPKMRGKKFMKTEEKQIFEVTPETIRWKIKIDVSTDLNAPTINEVEKEQKMQFFTQMANVSNAYQVNPKLEEIIPMKKAIEDLAKLNNIETDIAPESDVKEKKQELYAQMQNMLKGVRQPTPEDIAPTPELAQVSPDWQPPEIANVNTPNIPQ